MRFLRRLKTSTWQSLRDRWSKWRDGRWSDETGLTGHYDFKIHYEWMRRATDPATGVAPDPAPSVFTAVEEQLGLKLESATHSFPQLIIDAIDREPTDN